MFEAFPILFGLAGLAGVVWLGVIEPSQPGLLDPATLKAVPSTRRIDLGVAALAGGLLGARLEFCAAHFSYFASHPLDMLAVWQGGLAWGGGAIGAVLALLVAGWLMGVSFWRAADLVALPAAALSFSVWLGCQIDGCAYGFHTPAGWWTTTAPDWLGQVSPRWPTQTVGAITSLLLFAGLYWTAGRTWTQHRPGRLACITVGGIALIALALSLTRADPVAQLAGLRLDLVESLGLLLTAIAGLGFLSRSVS
jgi:phosphatidylglycerol:prolipoprotein diacylglycerol transferase